MAEKKRSTPTTRRKKGEGSEKTETTEGLMPLTFDFLKGRTAAKKRHRGKRRG